MGRWFSLCTLVFFTNKAVLLDITEILLKVALHTKTYNLYIDNEYYFFIDN